jgi:hypothetical protein
MQALELIQLEGDVFSFHVEDLPADHPLGAAGPGEFANEGGHDRRIGVG